MISIASPASTEFFADGSEESTVPAPDPEYAIVTPAENVVLEVAA